MLRRRSRAAPASSSACVDLTNTSDEDEEEENQAESGGDESGGEERSLASSSLEDDGLMVVEHPPASAAAGASPDDSVTVTLGDDDEACVVVGRSSSAIESLPHARSDCVLHRFAAGSFSEHCAMCYCYVCDKPAGECGEWQKHCEATHADLLWREERQQRKASQPRLPAAAPVIAAPVVVPAAAAAAPAPARPAIASTARQSNAVTYVALVKQTLAVQEPAEWKKFLEILRKYREQGKTSDYVLEHLTPLLHGKAELLAGLHAFIKPSSSSPSAADTGRSSIHPVSPPSDAISSGPGSGSAPGSASTSITGGGAGRRGAGGMMTFHSFFPINGMSGGVSPTAGRVPARVPFARLNEHLQ